MTAKRFQARLPVRLLRPDGTADRLVGTVNGTTMAMQRVTSGMVGAGAIAGRGATRTVAANNASARTKALADYVCDGTADQVEINAALTALGSVGGRVVLSEGTFALAAAVTFTAATKQVLRGQGMGATTLRVIDSGGAAVNTVMVQMYGNDNELADLTIDGNKANNAAQTNMYGLQADGARIAIRRVRILNVGAYGLVTSPATIDGVVRDCVIDGAGAQGAIFRATAGRPLVVSGCTVRNSASYGINCDSGPVVISDCQSLTNGASGFVTSGPGPVTFANCLAQGNNGHGFEAFTDTQVTDCRAIGNVAGFQTIGTRTQFNGCLASGGSGAGFISASGSVDALYHGCTSLSSPNHAFLHSSTGRSVYIGCRAISPAQLGFEINSGTVSIRDSFVYGTLSSYGVRLVGGSGHLVDGCRIVNIGGPGIQVHTPVPDCQITNNTLSEIGLAAPDGYNAIEVFGDTAFVARNRLRSPASGNRPWTAIAIHGGSDATFIGHNDTLGVGTSTVETYVGEPTARRPIKLLLDFKLTTTTFGAAMTGGQWYDVSGLQSFTVDQGSSMVEITCIASAPVGGAAGWTVACARLYIDEGAILRNLGRNHSEDPTLYQNAFGGTGSYKLGLSAGLHYIRVQIMCLQNANGYMRTDVYSSQEFLTLQVTEIAR